MPPASIRVRPERRTDDIKQTRFTEEQVIGIPKETEPGAKTADLARKYAVSEATIYNRKAKYGALEVSEARRLKYLESENAKLKRLLADTMLDNVALKNLLAKSSDARRYAGSCSSSPGLPWDKSELRARRVIDADRTSVRYRSTQNDDAELREKLRELANPRRRFGFTVGISSCAGRA